MARRYGKLYPDVAGRFIELERSERLTANAHILLWWLVARFRDGNQLKEREAAILADWVKSQKLDVEPGNVQVVQFSRKEASSCFNGQEKEVTRQVKKLINHGVLLPIGNHERGHSQLYVVCPNRVTKSLVECPPKVSSNEVTKPLVDCPPNDSNYGVTPNGKRGDIHTCEMGGHAKPVNCDNAPYQEVIIKNTNQASGAIVSGVECAEKSPLVCPECHKPDGVKVVNGGLATCNLCNSSWRVANG